MTIEKAFNRLIWRYRTENNDYVQYKPNANDVEALKFIAEWVNREKEIDIQENTIFAKMYVYCFIHELEFYKDIKFAQRKLHEVLHIPLPELYKRFLKQLNEFELNQFMKSKALDKNWISPEKLQDQGRTTEENAENLKNLFIGKWSKEQVDRSLNNQISEAINKYKNLP